MLTHLHIKNYTIIDELSIDFHAGMTVLTGETGAGKSIIIDTLELALGARIDKKILKQNKRCEITAIFSIANVAIAWLKQHELASEDECIIRRTIDSDGRSRSFINNTPCPQQSMRELASFLVNIHGQHEHQNLLRKDKQLDLLDAFAKNENLLKQTKKIFVAWQQRKQQLESLAKLTGNDNSRLEFLKFQLQELDSLALQENELEQLHQEQKHLANAEGLINNCSNILNMIDDGETSINAQLHYIKNQPIMNELNSVNELINNAIIQLEEATSETQIFLQKTEVNPEKLQQTEERLNKIYAIARKHRIKPEELFNLEQNLKKELQEIENADQAIINLKNEINDLEKAYLEVANKLTVTRKEAAKNLEKLVSTKMQALNMQNGKFSINIYKNENFSAKGLDQVEFFVITNPGQPAQPLTKIASGGELSRISLAIQVIAAQKETTPTLIFDEVDVGIGGATAQIVGELLKQLGTKSQVICITHLPQVAAQGNNHLTVTKNTSKDATTISVNTLNEESRINEIARMLGGLKITKQTLAHAKEML